MNCTRVSATFFADHHRPAIITHHRFTPGWLLNECEEQRVRELARVRHALFSSIAMSVKLQLMDQGATSAAVLVPNLFLTYQHPLVLSPTASF